MSIGFRSSLVRALVLVIATAMLAERARAAGEITTWLIVRHAEKQSTGGDPSLTSEGRDRAEQLKNIAVSLRVAAVYSTSAVRAVETAQPTADAIQQDVQQYTLAMENPNPTWFAAMKARHHGQAVLIVGHSNTVGFLIRGLGVPDEYPIEDDEFDQLCIVTTGDGTPVLANLRFGKDTSGRARAVRAEDLGPDFILGRIADRVGHKPAVPPTGVKFVPVRRVGNLLYLSGNLPFTGEEGIRSEHAGKVGEKGIAVEAARTAAQFATLNLLDDARKHLGSLDRVASVVEVFGVVNSQEGFAGQSKVIDGCSETLLEVFGEERGSHTRCAMGAAAIPSNACVEIKLILEIAPSKKE